MICPLCQQEAKDNKLKETRTLVTCAYCGKEFYKTKSKLDNSKSGLYFCCREHKDLAQRIDFGCVEIQPSHYGKASKDYREKAFREYEHKCSICGWDEDPDILEVHHIDENRGNKRDLFRRCAPADLFFHKLRIVDFAAEGAGFQIYDFQRLAARRRRHHV